MTGKNMYTSVLYTNLLCRNARCSWKWEGTIMRIERYYLHSADFIRAATI